ncbi:hypothetical protein PJO24_004977 [Salmonella enterica]|nr:hypothetical protein [Salmonella enterica]
MSMSDVLFALFMLFVGVGMGGFPVWFWWQRKWEAADEEFSDMRKEVELAKDVFARAAGMQNAAYDVREKATAEQKKALAVAQEALREKLEAERRLQEERIRFEGIIRQKHRMMVNAIAAAERRSRKADGKKRLHIDHEGGYPGIRNLKTEKR